ncbi:hypothetical protein SAMN02745146_3150 [Hymenobacter daecheongensis DSM 21074]|uniref:Uncharacterized protein n=1 Tax=Hymenobacter daecheongensis DSM 21074 TaxID=1121955 RepID=A0A1M6J970_9BACT|nr:hypothetical protein SAMN02745146_3150 [Hymenobacter daecheongensis DSM 21074]
MRLFCHLGGLPMKSSQRASANAYFTARLACIWVCMVRFLA